MIHMRSFLPQEIENQQFLVNKNIKFCLVQITATGLKKSILDATTPMRAYFLENNIHNYERQLQGPAHKHLVKTHILSVNEGLETKTSMYRPETKLGDPRLWIYRLTDFTKADDIHAIIAVDGVLYVINITQVNIALCYHSLTFKSNPIRDLIQSLYSKSISVSEELLQKFRLDAGVWHASEVTADTGIGRTIETLLGIEMNSSKLADYKGIEIKSHREKRKTQKNVLFTQTPDWNLSRFKSGIQIVNKYGYPFSADWLTLQNTLSCDKPNSQNMQLNVDQIKALLEMKYISDQRNEDIAVWRLVKLHERLATKHHETFWVEVKNQIVDNKEYFCYSFIEHTKNPILSQFDILLEQSLITLDIMLHRPDKHGDTYSFKIKKKAMPLLFPESTIYNLLNTDSDNLDIFEEPINQMVAQEKSLFKDDDFS